MTIATGVAGLATIKQWTTPVVESVMLPAHAQTTGISPPQIFNLRSTGDPSCLSNGDDQFQFFNIEYSFSSVAGVVSHVVAAACGDDALQITSGLHSLGENLLGGTSFTLTGNQFAGDVVIDTNSISGTAPLSCLITVTLTDANGGQVSASITMEECLEP